MIAFAQANVLTIDIGKKNDVLQEFPLRLLTVHSAAEAASSLKSERVDCIISRWNLVDMADGLFLRRLKAIKPDIPILAIIKSDQMSQEIAARSLGVSAVLTDEGSDMLFQQMVANILRLKSTIPGDSVDSLRRRISNNERFTRK